MNCCDDFGQCAGGHGCPARSECHVPCSAPPQQPRYPFAPGVIDRGEPVSRVDVLGRWLLAMVCLAALVAVVGIGAGYINLPGLMP